MTKDSNARIGRRLYSAIVHCMKYNHTLKKQMLWFRIVHECFIIESWKPITFIISFVSFIFLFYRQFMIYPGVQNTKIYIFISFIYLFETVGGQLNMKLRNRNENIIMLKTLCYVNVSQIIMNFCYYRLRFYFWHLFEYQLVY